MINSDDVKVCSIYKYFYFERYSGGDLDMCLNFVVRELDGYGGGQVSPFSYGIKWENGRILEMFSERVENLRGFSGGALGSIAKWHFSI